MRGCISVTMEKNIDYLCTDYVSSQYSVKTFKIDACRKQALYKDTLSGRRFHGSELSEIGLEIGKISRDGDSQQWLLEKVSEKIRDKYKI